MIVAARVIGQSNIVANDKVGVAVTDAYELWLLNDTEEMIELDACELFGFGMGAYVAKAAGWAIFQPLTIVHHDSNPIPTFGAISLVLTGTARSESDKYIPWILSKDTDIVIHVAESGKSPTCLSEMACQAAQRQGLTEMTLVDHGLTQRIQDLMESC